MVRPAPRAAIAFVVLYLLPIAHAAPQTAPATPSQPPNELDAFMQKVLARREVNRKVLQQYILNDDERVEILGPGRTPLYRMRREFTWYVRDGMHVRSPLRFDGVAVSEDDRRKYEEDWIRRERGRLEREKQRKKDKRKGADESSAPDTSPQQEAGSGIPIATPRFVSEAYFMDFKFEAGNYYLAGREQIEGKDVLRIEYYPQHLFNDDDDDDRQQHENKSEQSRKPAKDEKSRERRAEQDIDRKMNKTALVTLWVDPTESQIVKYTFDNIWMDFLPAAWLVRIDDIRASMTMGQPIPGVWLPRSMQIHGGVSLASGPFEATYARTFSDYRLADVKSTIRIPKQEAELIRDPGEVRGHGPYVEDDEGQQPEVVGEIRVHGNSAIPDEDIVRLAGITVGQTLEADALEAIARRLKESGRFQSVDVRKRYRSLTSTTDVALVLVVHERPGVTSIAASGVPGTGPLHHFTSRLLFLPILSYADGYGFTYGARVSTIDLLGAGERLSVPLTWGGTRRVALEFERVFKTGPLTRVSSSIALWNRDNPHFEIRDQRVEWGAGAERQFAKVLRAGFETSTSSVDFGELDDRLWTIGASVGVDTRGDPAFPRNAIVARTGWTGLHFRSLEDRIDRYTTDVRGYLGVWRQLVFAGRVQYMSATGTLPPYERLLVGGSPTLRGFEAGAFDGDRTFVSSAELRLPLTSVLSGARLGVTAFTDASKAYDFTTRFEDAEWHQGVGGGVFLIASLVKLNLDIAHGLRNGDTRVHFSTGFSF